MTLSLWVVLAFLAAFAASVVIERAAAIDAAPPPAPSALPARLAGFVLLGLIWLGIFDRGLLAALAALIPLAIMTAITLKKRRLVGEPLVFSDFGLIRLIVKHPDLYYTAAFTSAPALLAGAAGIAAIGLWLWLEPPLLSLGPRIAVLVGSLAACAAFWWAARTEPVARRLRRIVPEPDLENHVGRWGQFLTILVYALRWRGETALPYPPADGALPAGLDDIDPQCPDLVVVVQLESFIDVEHRLAEPALPGLAAARARALLHGRLRVPSHGAYTMRSEFAVLSGLSGDDLGFRRFDPYLSTIAGSAPVSTLATRLRRAGFATLFMHPFRAGFFDRERVMRRLGFEAFRWEADFDAADRAGPYTSDPALIRRILADIAELGQREPGRPAFVMAVTMENHGPWQAGRLPGETDPTRQYLAHLRSSDRAIGLLVEGLSRFEGRALVCLFGDHPPILPGLDPAAVPETDYVVLELGRDARPAAPRIVALTADALGRLLVRLCGRAAADAAPPA